MAILDECYKYLWDNLVINYNGTILGCCYNTDALFCNEMGFDNIIDKLNHPSIRTMRRNLLSDNIEGIISERPPCIDFCSIFKRNSIETLKKENLISRMKFFKNHGYNESFSSDRLSIVKVEDIKNIYIELNSYCQLRCPGCWRFDPNSIKALGMGMIIIDNFIKLLDQLPYLKTIGISLNGESLLHPQFAQIVDICRERGIIPTCQIGFNLNYLTKESAEALVKARCDNITCSIDGASQETYSRYRVDGSFDKVLENIKLLNYYKKFYKSDKPTLYWKMIIFNWNIHEIDKARKMAEELEMEFFISRNVKSRIDMLTQENQTIFNNFIGLKSNMVKITIESDTNRKVT